ncbi:MAG: phenylalanine--tRNA ligase subunit beta [Malacoplasma sp.]
MFLSKKLFASFFPQFKKTNDEQFCEMLNSVGIEVENVHKFKNTNGLIVGEILSVEKHPKSDKLNLCTVFFKNQKHLIVCGAENVLPNKKVIVAKINTTMLDGRVIEKKSILGIESNGMICSYSELSDRCDYLSEIDLDNIVILDDSAKLDDEEPLKYIGLDDVIFDLSIASNRNELNGILSIGYDLLPLLNIDNRFDFSINLEGFKKSKINIKSSSSNFYSLIEVENWNIKESSWKTKFFLMNSGIIPINSIVDISNLNMIISGNPSHAFSANSISGDIEIKNGIARKFFGLNNTEYKIDKNDICIVSNNNVLALAGIIGGLDSSIKKVLNEKIIFEIANFDNLLIKKTSDRLELKTQSAIIFSKRLPLWISMKALEIFATLLSEMDCKIIGINYTKPDFHKTKINFDCSKIIKLLGSDVDEKKIIDILKSFGFTFDSKNTYLTPPVYREDILNINDVTEEILKKININNLKPIPIGSSFVNFEFNYEYKNYLYLKTFFLNKGFSQLKTYNLTSANKNQLFNIFNQKNNIEIINPLSKDKVVFRNNILEKHLEVLKKNISYKNKLMPVFEIQKLPINGTNSSYLSCLVPIDIFFNKIDNSKLANNILLLKSLINDLFMNFGFTVSFTPNNRNFPFVKENNSLLITVDKETIGIMGELDFTFNKEYDFKDKLFFMELNIDKLILKNKSIDFNVSEIDNKHPIKRDISVVINKGLFNAFEKTINKINYIKSYEIKNLYEFDINSISYNIEFIFIFDKDNPSSEEISSLFNKLIIHLEDNKFLIRKSS